MTHILHGERFKQIPEELLDGLIYLTVAGSTAYGTASEASDNDLIGIYIPPRQYMYPQEYGYIQGFSSPQPAMPTTKQIHHIYDEASNEYDINLFHIAKFFELACLGNPNILDFINTDVRFHLHKTRAGQLIYENRKLFYSKDMYPKFRGMIKNHMETIMKPQTGHGHADLIAKFGYDTKDAGHVIRVQLALLDILKFREYEIDAHKEFIKGIRYGGYPLDFIKGVYEANAAEAESLIKTTYLREHVNREQVREVFQECLNLYYA